VPPDGGIRRVVNHTSILVATEIASQLQGLNINDPERRKYLQAYSLISSRILSEASE
jgi:hypothetical protein